MAAQPLGNTRVLDRSLAGRRSGTWSASVAVKNGLHWGKCGEILVFLDEERGRYAALGPEAAALWEKLFGPSSSRGAGQEGWAGSDLCADDFDLLREARDLGWLVEGAAPEVSRPSTRPPKRHFLLMRAFWLLLRMQRLVGRCGLRHAYSAARSYTREIRPSGPPKGVPLDLLLRRFRHADRWVSSSLGAEDCLPRSLALFAFLRSGGLAVTHHVGVAQFPFRAHAWVELDGAPLLEREGRTAAFVEIARLA
jgi:hypothetical protein